MYKITLGLFVLSNIASSQEILGALPANCNKTFEQIVTDAGYAVEVHQQTTLDGYILKSFRIPGKTGEKLEKQADGKTAKEVVVLWHGLLDSADLFIVNHKEVSHAFTVSDMGYDVWLGNSRGNKYSHAHEYLDPAQAQYWDFGFEEMGSKDVPALLDYIEKTTGHKKVAYAAHSQGTSQMLYGMSELPAYYEGRISLFIIMAPPVYMENTYSPVLQLIRDEGELITEFITTIGGEELLPSGGYLSNQTTALCQYSVLLCELANEFIADADFLVDDSDAFQVYMSHYPSGSSWRAMNHFGQLAKSGDFTMYNFYDENKNLLRYGQKTPPVVNLDAIKDQKIAIFEGLSDEFVAPADAQRLNAKLGDNMVFYKEFNLGHLSFGVAKDMDWWTDEALELLRTYHPVTKAAQFLRE